MAAVTICSDFGAQKIKSDTVSTVSPSICHEMMGPDEKVQIFNTNSSHFPLWCYFLGTGLINLKS